VDEFPGSHLPRSIASGLTYDPATASRRPVIRTMSEIMAEQEARKTGLPSHAEGPARQEPVPATVASGPATANAKNEESLEKYGEICDRIWEDMGRDNRPIEPPAASFTPAWKRKRKTG
jgi:hypothetical protein